MFKVKDIIYGHESLEVILGILPTIPMKIKCQESHKYKFRGHTIKYIKLEFKTIQEMVQSFGHVVVQIFLLLLNQGHSTEVE